MTKSADTHCPYCALQCAMTLASPAGLTPASRPGSVPVPAPQEVPGRDIPTNPGGRCRNASCQADNARNGLASSAAAAAGQSLTEFFARTAGTASSVRSEAVRMLMGTIDKPFRRSAAISLLMKVCESAGYSLVRYAMTLICRISRLQGAA